MKTLLLSTERTGEPASQNYAGFDSLRAFAAIGVVLLHCCVPYAEHPMPGLAWSVTDDSSRLIDCLFWAIEVVIMPIFLVLAGFLAWQTMVRRGPRALMINRSKRLLIPLLFACFVVLPLDLYTWLLGWVAEGTISPVKLRSLKFDGVIDKDLWGLSHLWFLMYLFLYISVLAGIVSLGRRLHWISPMSRQPSNLPQRMLSATLVFVGVVTLSCVPQVVWGFQHAFLPVPSKWIYSGTFFAGGVLLAAFDPNLLWLQRQRIVWGVAGGMLCVTAVTLGRWHLDSAGNFLLQCMLALVTVLCAWSVTFGFIAASLPVKQLSIPIRYLAAASFWVYLIHHPVLGLVHIDLKFVLPGVSPVLKTALSFVICMSVSLLTYEAFVRRTRLGRILGMDWQLPNEKPTENSVPVVRGGYRQAA